MVAAAKLRRAQEKAIQARPFAEALESMTHHAMTEQPDAAKESLLLSGRPENPVHLIVVVTSDRGLCGGFNANIAREARVMVRDLQAQNIPVKLYCVGRKGQELLRRDFRELIVHTQRDLGRKGIVFSEAQDMAKHFEDLIATNICGQISVVYSVFESVLSQAITRKQIIPLQLSTTEPSELYEFEPDQETVVHQLLPKNFAIQLFQILVETNASEHGARMTAMDNATRNARDVIKRLELTYNRTRQAHITKELIEIISGAEAL